MRGRGVFIFIFLALFLCISTASRAAEDIFIVSEIKIEGLERIPDGTLLNYLPVKEGDPLDQKQISFAVRELYKTGFFTDITLARENNVLIVSVKERPSVLNVEFSGNSDIDTEQLEESLESIGLSKGRPYDQSILDRMVNELERVYFSRGKYGVRISSEVTEQDQNRVDIHITISEGRVARIKQINIIGNEIFDDEKLTDEFKLGIVGSFSIFSSADEYSKPLLAADLETLKSYYQNRGYIRFSIESTQVTITPDKNDIYITINVVEDDQYNIEDINISGDLVGEEKSIRSLVQIRKGTLFSRREVADSEEAIKSYLGNLGYAFANVDVIPEINDSENKVSLKFVIDPGKKVYVRRINFHGNYNTREYVLRREMRLMESSELASGKLERSRIRLQRLSYIEDVDIQTVSVPGTDDQVDLEVVVTERLSGTFNVGAGFSQTQGLLFNVGLTQENLFGTGKTLNLNVNTDRANTVYSISHTEPYYTQDGISRTLSASFRDRDAGQENINDFQTDSQDVRIIYGIPLSEFNTIRLGVGLEQINLTESSINPSQEVLDFINENGKNYVNGTLTASFSHDTRNRTVFATTGSSQTIGLNMTIPSSDLSFYKISYRTRFFFPLTNSLTLLLKSDITWGDSYGKSSELPFYERFFAGGLRTVRGYDTNTLGPRESTTNAATGGDYRVVGNAEFIFPVPFVDKPPSSIRFSAFYDIGNVFKEGVQTFDSNKSGFDVDQLRQSVGVSFVWLAPIGPLRFSWAQPINNRPGDQLRQFQFSIGSFF